MSVLERCMERDGLVMGCRFIRDGCYAIARLAGLEAHYYCSYIGSTVQSCEDCTVCPRCGGKMKEERDLALEESPPAYHRRMVCVICSHNRKGTVEPCCGEVEPEAAKKADRCSVHRCLRNAYEGYTFESGQPICSVHRDQVYHWKRSGSNPDRKPFILKEGVLFENPLYSRQGRK